MILKNGTHPKEGTKFKISTDLLRQLVEEPLERHLRALGKIPNGKTVAHFVYGKSFIDPFEQGETIEIEIKYKQDRAPVDEERVVLLRSNG